MLRHFFPSQELQTLEVACHRLSDAVSSSVHGWDDHNSAGENLSGCNRFGGWAPTTKKHKGLKGITGTKGGGESDEQQKKAWHLDRC